MIRTLTAAITLMGIAGFLLTTGAAVAKGPFSLKISGGDLVEPVTVDGPVAAAGMSAAQTAPPQPHPEVIYPVDSSTRDAPHPAGTISYSPPHDGLPAAWQTKYGFWAVPAGFKETFEGYLPVHDGGTSAL